MKIFRADKKKFLVNELKSWLFTIVFFGIIFLIYSFFSTVDYDRLGIAASVLFLSKLGDTIVPYYVREIRVDSDKNKLVFILSSRLSGREEKLYNLDETKSILIARSGLKSWPFKKSTLKIYLPKKRIFTINSRYGFTPQTLKQIAATIG